MKQTTKYILALMVMILSVTGVMASGNATYIKKIDGVATTTTDPGSVSLSISAGTGTITVTPAAGNYLTAADLTVIKTVDGSNAEARRRTVPINDPIVVTPTDATADPSLATSYTFTVTDATFDYEITADFHSRADISGATVTVVGGPFAHTGAAIEPSVTVTLGAATLTEGTDYTLSYASNINVGTGQITVTGIRTYTGTIGTTFTIYEAKVTVTATGYYGVYDGEVHGITVTAPADATVKYGETPGVYDLEVSPTYVNAGTYTVYYQATKAGLNATTGSETVVISKAPATISYATTSVKKTYGDNEFTNALTMTGDGIETYSSSDRDVAVVDANSGEVMIVGEGTATITATAADGMNYAYDPNTASYEITVEKARMTVTSAGWTGDYDGQPHSITVNAPEGAKVRYGRAEDSYNLNRLPTYTNTGSYTCYYQVTMDNYYPVTGHETVTINKAAAVISFETASVEKTKGDDPFTNPLTNTGDGKVTYSTSNSSIAAVNATTGEVTIKNYGTATITATVKEGVNYVYAENTATFDVVVGTASMEVTATGYNGIYDGQSHGITVTAPEGAKVRYGETEGEYTLYTSPKYTNAGTYTVYYQVTKTNYTTVTGSATVTIAKADAKVSFAQKELTAKIGKDFTTPQLTLDPANLTVTYTSSDEEVATVDAETGEVELVSPGEVTITATFAGNDNYNGASDAYVLTVLQRDIEPIDEDVVYTMDEKDFFIFDDEGNLVEVKLDNTVIFDILYTLDITGDPAESDGYDETEHCIVLNHPMATNDVDRIIFNGVEPGTDEYAGEYIGLTFKVPAGKGYVIIDSQTDGDYKMMVKIGELDPIAFNHTSREKDSVFYECTTPTWVYVYNGGEVSKARMADHRARKTKGRVKIYSVTRSNSSQAPTGIEIINADALESGRWYDLQGNRIGRPTKKGLYILRGQKVIVR